MPRTVVLLLGLGAALIAGGLSAVRSGAVPDTNEGPWAEQGIEDVAGGQTYRLHGCVTVTAPGLRYVSLRLAWYERPAPSGESFIHQEDRYADIRLIGLQQCLSLTHDAPCAARSAQYGVVVGDDVSAVEVSNLEFSLEADVPPIPCPTSTPTPTPTPASTPTPAATPTATPPPPSPPPPARPEATATADAPTEPKVFPLLVNGGFEDVWEDGAPYGWNKFGGTLSTSTAIRAEGDRSAELASGTESTKWLYQTVSVEGNSYYGLQAKALKNDPGVREALLRVSWYESVDGSGRQISTADSGALVETSSGFATLDTGPVQAPVEARSAKVRLMLRPASGRTAIVYFDDVRFREVVAPPTEDTWDDGRSAQGEIRGERSDGPPTAKRAIPGAAALSAWAGPTPLANVKREPPAQDPPTETTGRPTWPLILALAAPGAGLVTVAAHARWRHRLSSSRNM